MISRSTRPSGSGPFVQSSRVCSAAIGNELFLFDLDERRLHVLNPTASSVWSGADQPTDVDTLSAEIAASYSTSAAAVRGDVAHTVTTLIDTGLLVAPEFAAAGRPNPGVDLEAAAPEIDVNAADYIGSFVALGVEMSIHCNDADLAHRLEAVLDPIRHGRIVTSERVEIRVERVGEAWSVSSDGTLIIRTGSPEMAARTVLRQCNGAPLRHLEQHVVFHAAAADLGSGTVMFPGISNSGKSTLVTQLLERGHSYLTDEAVAVDVRSLRALPFHKAICLETGAQSLFPHLESASRSIGDSIWDVDPRQVGAGALAPGGVMSAVVFPTFDPNATTCSISQLTPTDAARMLLANAFSFDVVGQPAFEAIVALAEMVPAYSMIHSGGQQPLDELERMTRLQVLSL